MGISGGATALFCIFAGQAIVRTFSFSPEEDGSLKNASYSDSLQREALPSSASLNPPGPPLKSVVPKRETLRPIPVPAGHSEDKPSVDSPNLVGDPLPAHTAPTADVSLAKPTSPTPLPAHTAPTADVSSAKHTSPTPLPAHTGPTADVSSAKHTSPAPLPTRTAPTADVSSAKHTSPTPLPAHTVPTADVSSAPSSATSASDILEASEEPYALQRQRVSDLAVNNTIVVTISNYGYLKWLRQWHAHIEKLGISNWVIVSLDPKLHAHLEARTPGHSIMFDALYHSAFNAAGVSSAFNRTITGDKTFTHLVASKPAVLVNFARWGFDTFFVDADVMVLKDPFSSLDPTCDMAFQVERKNAVIGLNSGVFVWSSKKQRVVEKLMIVWKSYCDMLLFKKRDNSGITDQEALQKVMRTMLFGDRFKVKIKGTPGYPARVHYSRGSKMLVKGAPITFCTLPADKYPAGNHLPCTKELKSEKFGESKNCSAPDNWEHRKSSTLVLAHQNDMIHDEEKIKRAKVLGFWIEGSLSLDE